MKKKSKIMIVVIIIVSIVLFLSAGTLAYWYWSNIDDAKNLVVSIAGVRDSDINYTEGESHFLGNFQPFNTFCESSSTTLSFSKKETIKDINLGATIHLDINSIGTNISSSDDVYWVVTKGENSITCEDGLDSSSVLSYGTFNGVEAGDVLDLLSNVIVTISTKTITVWIWIDSAGSDLENLSGQSLDVNVWTEINMLADVEPLLPGLYNEYGGYTSWDDLVTNGDITLSGTTIHDVNTSLSGELIIADGVTAIGLLAFRDCSSLTSINIPKGVISIGKHAFNGCSNLTSINIPEEVTSIGDYAFYGCSNLTSINIPDGVTSIGNYAFYNCSNLTSINISEGITSIGNYVFYGCSSLTNINIPEGVTSIGDSAFRDCSSLANINIPKGVTSIGDYAFYACSLLSDVYYAGSRDEWSTIIIGLENSSLNNATIYYNE